MNLPALSLASFNVDNSLKMGNRFVSFVHKRLKETIDGKTALYIKIAVIKATSLQKLIVELYEYVQANPLNPGKEVVDFNIILHEVEKNISASKAQHEAVIYIHSGLLGFPVLKRKITRVFQTLITNAIKLYQLGITLDRSSFYAKVHPVGSLQFDAFEVEILRRIQKEIYSRWYSKSAYLKFRFGLVLSDIVSEGPHGKIWV